MSGRLTVGIIGAGAAGLAAARAVISKQDVFHEPIVLERSNYLGGIWSFSDAPLSHQDESTGGYVMYHSLRTNLPKEVMGFPDFPFDPDSCSGLSFVRHQDIQQYLSDYADLFSLRKYIKFQTTVRNVRPDRAECVDSAWIVDTVDVSGRCDTLHFDVLFVCNGHYSEPRWPQIDGLADFQGGVTHSSRYRRPAAYKDRVVLVLGAASSGCDICLEVSSVAKQVYLSHNLAKYACTFPANVIQVGGVANVLSRGVRFVNDSCVTRVDDIILCTGYKFSYPFLSAACGVRVSQDSHHVLPLHEHIVNCHHRRMAFIGIPFVVLPFPLFHIQAAYFCACISGIVPLFTNNQLKPADESRDHDVTPKNQSASTNDKCHHDITAKDQSASTNDKRHRDDTICDQSASTNDKRHRDDTICDQSASTNDIRHRDDTIGDQSASTNDIRHRDDTIGDQSATTKHPHVLAHRQWAYMRRLALASRCAAPCGEAVRRLYEHVGQQRRADLVSFRRHVYRLPACGGDFVQLTE